MTRIVLLGSGGFIGKSLLPKLTLEGFSVKPMIHYNSINHVDEIHGDILDPTVLDSILNENDVVVNLIGQYIDNDSEFIDINIQGGLNLLNSCVKNNVSNFIFSSSHAVYGKTRYLPIDETHNTDSKTSYGISKLMGENLCKLFNNNFNLNTSILRISSVYGKNQPKTKLIPNLILNSKKSKKIFLDKYKNGFQIMDMIHVDDVCNSIFCAIKNHKNFGIYNIATGKSITVEDIAKHIRKINNSEIIINNIPKKINHYKYDVKRAISDLKFNSKISFDRKIKEIYYDVIQNE